MKKFDKNRLIESICTIQEKDPYQLEDRIENRQFIRNSWVNNTVHKFPPPIKRYSGSKVHPTEIFQTSGGYPIRHNGRWSKEYISFDQAELKALEVHEASED